MRWTNLHFLLLQLIPILASVDYFKKHDLYLFSELLNSGIDNNTDPCNDFYQYTCGKWIKNNEIPDTFDTWDVHDMTKLSTELMMQEVLENPNIDESNKELSVEKKIYNACMDEGYSREEGGRVLEEILLETPSQRWQDVAEYYAIKFSAFDLFHIRLNQSKHLQIERPHSSKSNEKLFEDIENDVKFGVNWLYHSVPNSYINNTLSYDEVVRKSLGFIDIVNHITFRIEEDIQTISILELQVLYDNHCPSEHVKIKWLQFFQRLAEGSTNFTIYDELIVDVKYLINLCQVLRGTPEYAIVNYLQYNIVFNNDTAALTKIGRNRKSYTERYLDCMKTLKITEGTTKEILELHVPSTSRIIVHEMFMGIISAMIKEIENSWLVNSLKEFIVSEIKEITYRYGIVDNYFEEKLGIEGVYEFEVGRVAFQNELNLKRAQIINILRVYKEAHRDHRAKRSSICTACYIFDKNEFVVGVAMMFSPYFYENAPIGFNYGRLGFTIGHEISHAFDIEFLNCLISCMLSEHEKEEMKSMLEGRKNCFVDEFNSLGIDGLRTLDENIADTQGIKRAWKAMNAVIRDKETEDEGHQNFEHWNQMKLFFLSFANQWCSNPEYREDTGVDTHAPHVFRTLETLKNMNEFAETYDCTSGETMNPLMKCDLWANSSRTDSQYMFKKLKKYFK